MRFILRFFLLIMLMHLSQSCSADEVNSPEYWGDEEIAEEEEFIFDGIYERDDALAEDDAFSPDGDFDEDWETDESTDGAIEGGEDTETEENAQDEWFLDTPFTDGGLVTMDDPLHIFFTKTYSGNEEEAKNYPLNPDKALIELIQSARESIDASLYDIEHLDIARELIRAKDRGITVRIVTDDGYLDRDACKMLIDNGISVIDDDHADLMHNKFLIIDETIVWTGSMNISTNGVWKNQNNTLMIFSSSLARNYQTEFEEQFIDRRFHNRSLDNTDNHFTLRLPDDTSFRIDNYFSPDEPVAAHIVEDIDEADSHVYFMAFSFTSDPIRDAMIRAHDRGLRVQGIFEARGATSQGSDYQAMLDAGIEVKKDGNGRSMHHKVILIDGKIVWTGSYNFSASAEERNDENVIVLHHTQIGAIYENEFEHLWAIW